METAFFWIAWGLISFWAIKTFYFSFSKNKFERLRKAAFGINLSVLILFFFPWLPPSLGEKSGFTLALEGNALAFLFFILLIISTVLFLTKNPLHLKIASGATIANTVVLFIIMIQLRRETFTLSFFDMSPIIAALLLFIGDVAVLLLWQQLQLKEKEKQK